MSRPRATPTPTPASFAALAAALLLSLLVGAPSAHAQRQVLREGELKIEFPRELIGYRHAGEVVTPSRFPSIAELEQRLARDETQAVLFFKLYEDEHNHYAPKFAPGAGTELGFLRADVNRRTSKIRLLPLGAGRARTLMDKYPDSYDYMYEYAPAYPWLKGQPLAAFASQAETSGDMNLYLAAGAQRPVRVTRGRDITKHPSFHPTAAQLLFEARGRVHLLEFPATLAELGRLTSPPGTRVLSAGAQPQWSPDGRSFAYCREVGRIAGRPTFEVSVRSHPFGRERRMYRGKSTDIIRNPVWSPDGKYVAFYRRSGEAFGWELHVAEVATSKVTKLADKVVVENHFDDVDPAWAPASESGAPRLYFFSTQDSEEGYYRIHWVDVTGKRGVVDYSDEFTTANDLALPRSAEALPQVAFVAIERLSQGVYVVVLNHW